MLHQFSESQMPLPDFSSEREEKIKAFEEGGGEEKKVASDLPGIPA